MTDFGIKVSSNGNDAKIATGSELIMSSKYPLAKIDRTNPTSFQNIHIVFNNNPPLGPVLVYKFKHGYTYTPTIWSLVQSFGVGAPYTADPYIMDAGDLLHDSMSSYCQFYVEADSQYVYYYVNRLVDTRSGVNVTVAGVALRVRTYVFVEDVQM